jgi:hypothetical protein
MTLINTEGMAFIGPGSEWFWIALQFIALSITFIAIYRQLRTQQGQIRDNAKVLRSQAHYSALMVAQRPLEMLIGDEGLARIVNVGHSTPDALSEVEWARYGSYLFLLFNGWEYFYYQHRDASIPKEIWVGADGYFKGLVETKPGVTRFWSEFQTSFDEPFRSYAAGKFVTKPTPAGVPTAAAKG